MLERNFCNSISRGYWTNIEQGNLSRVLQWLPYNNCTFLLDPEGRGSVNPNLFFRLFNNHHIWLLGDSVSRFAFLDLVDTLGGSYILRKFPALRFQMGGKDCRTSSGVPRSPSYKTVPFAQFEVINHTVPKPFGSEAIHINFTNDGVTLRVQQGTLYTVNISYVFVSTAQSLLLDAWPERMAGPALNRALYSNSPSSIYVLNAGLWDLQKFIHHWRWNSAPVPDTRLSSFVSDYRDAVQRIADFAEKNGKGTYFWRTSTPIFNPTFDPWLHPEWRFSINDHDPPSMIPLLNNEAVGVLHFSKIYVVEVDHVWSGLQSSPADITVLSDDFHHMKRVASDHVNVEVLSAVAHRLKLIKKSSVKSQIVSLTTGFRQNIYDIEYATFLMPFVDSVTIFLASMLFLFLFARKWGSRGNRYSERALA